MGHLTAESPLWLHIRDLCDFAGRKEAVFPVVPDGQERLGQAVNRQGILAWNEGSMHGRANYLLNWIEDVINLKNNDAWEYQRPYLRRFVRRYYSRESFYPAWVVVNACRIPLASRVRTLAQKLIEQPRYLTNATDIRRLPIRTSGLHLRSKPLLWASKEGRLRPDQQLTLVEIWRTLPWPRTPLPRPGNLHGYERWWCIANPEEDGDTLQKGWIPAGTAFSDGTVNCAHIITFVRVCGLGGMIDRVALELEPGSGCILSKREAEVRLEMSLAMDAVECDFLTRIARG